MRNIRRRTFIAHIARLAIAGVLCATPLAHLAAQTIPTRIEDAVFWRMVTDFSESGGYFRSDNFVSNETTFQHVIPELDRTTSAGGVYLGVGPDQNFTYITAMRPKIAFIIDIRRQNMLQHLMYKALIELSPERADFLSRLFSRPRPAGLGANTTPDALFLAYEGVASDSVLYRKTMAAITRQLVEQHKFALSEEDMRAVEYVFTAFYAAGPDLTYSFASPGRGAYFGDRRMPTYGELMVESDAEEQQRSYLATEANYRVLRELQRNNLIVPLVGDFAGDKAIRSVGRWVRERDATVTAFYLSNVEQYLFQQNDNWRRFFDNVATLPVDSSSTFIRAVFNNMAYRPPVRPSRPGPRSVTLLAPITEQLKAVADGRIQSYFDVIQFSRETVPQQ